MAYIQLVPNISVGYLKINDHIEDYFGHKYVYYKKEAGDKYMEDYYEFPEENIIAFVNSRNLITTINCEFECYWKGKNLIKLPFEDFKILAGGEPDDHENIYILSNAERGQNQHVYTFEGLGLQIWVWRSKIVTVSCTNYNV